MIAHDLAYDQDKKQNETSLPSPLTISDWLFVHGLAKEKRHWKKEFIDSFSSTMNCKIHMLDLPGAGSEFQRKSPGTISDLSNDLRARLFAQGLHLEMVGQKVTQRKRWGILGVSLGGMVALDWMHRYPDDFAVGCVAVTSASDLNSMVERMNWHIYPDLIKTFASSDLHYRESKIIAYTTNFQNGDRRALAREWEAFTRTAPVSRRTFLAQIAAGARFTAPESLLHPILVLGSWGDKLVSPHCTIKIAEKYRASLAMHAWSGHDLTQDDNEWVIQQIKFWLASNPLSNVRRREVNKLEIRSKQNENGR